MILAGIDEAGYGPLLGPLVVGCCAFELEGSATDSESLPCLWSKLGKLVSKTRSRSGKKLHIHDSKVVYAPADGLRELERSVLAMASAWRSWPDSTEGLLKLVAEHALEDLPHAPWYHPPEADAFPISQEGMPIRLFSNALRLEMERVKTRCVHLAARVVLERPLNRLLEQTRNKSNALFSIAAIHLDTLLKQFGDRQLFIFCDRQGGREHYGPMLRLMFEDWSLEILRESEGHSEYHLQRGGHVVALCFREKAEARCLPVAMASMLSKYLREALMHRFNAWWAKLLPGLAPTAGYYTDGQRFLADIAATRQQLGITDGDLIRLR